MKMDEDNYRVGDRVCVWFGDSIYCGTLREIDEHTESTWLGVDVDMKDGQPLPPELRERHLWQFLASDDIWLMCDGPSGEMREKMRWWYRSNLPDAPYLRELMNGTKPE